jgi:hypothetical protein
MSAKRTTTKKEKHRPNIPAAPTFSTDTNPTPGISVADATTQPPASSLSTNPGVVLNNTTTEKSQKKGLAERALTGTKRLFGLVDKPKAARGRTPASTSSQGIPTEYMEGVSTPPPEDLGSRSAISASALAILPSRVNPESQEDVVEGNADDAGGGLGNNNRPKDDDASNLALGLTTGQGSMGRQPLEGITEKKAGLTFGEMTKRVTVSPQQKAQEENDTAMKWLVAAQEVLTAVKDIPGGVVTATGATAVIGPLIGILKLIEVGQALFLLAVVSELWH